VSVAPMNTIRICMGTSGISAGAEDVADAFTRELERHGIADRFQIIRTGDRGLFRDVLVDVTVEGEGTTVYQYLRKENVADIVEQHLVGGTQVKKFVADSDYEDFFAGQMRIVLGNCGLIDPESIDDYVASGGYAALEKALELSPEQVVETVNASGLRGRGGAGFPTGRKWQFCRDADGKRKHIVCNADEGDPGAFMDRSILEGDPHAVLEGMVIAGYAVGACDGVIYCRAEYPLAVKRLVHAIEQAEARGYLGTDIRGSGFAFNISLMQGAGAFVCGEETALLASIEGGKGIPRTRPPFPAQSGLWGEPTVINNVETLANVRHIIAGGAEAFSAVGTEKSKGTKVFALAGKIRNTGLVEVPMGTTIRDLVFGPGGGMARKRDRFKAVQLGGPSGGCLPESLCDVPIDYESIAETGAIMGSGGMIIMDSRTCMVDLARYFLSFTVEESCGKCVPCRVGLKRMLEVLEKIVGGHGTKQDVAFLRRMASTIRETALCGLGNTAPNPVLTTLRYFPDEYDAHINEKECPSHACADLVHFEVMADKCTKCGRCKSVCPADAIEWKKGRAARIDIDKCIRCTACIAACDFAAIR
jgi:NADH-quinone oxidoreductase subunit F